MDAQGLETYNPRDVVLDVSIFSWGISEFCCILIAKIVFIRFLGRLSKKLNFFQNVAK
jgi:hypothetical protein